MQGTGGQLCEQPIDMGHEKGIEALVEGGPYRGTECQFQRLEWSELQ